MTTSLAHVSGRYLLRLLLPALLVGVSVHADDAPIPIDQPTVITASGSYVVTADFTAATGSAIRVIGTVTVTIDFAGHTVEATSAPVIMLRDGTESVCPAVSLHDGRIVGPGGGYGSGVYSWTAFWIPCYVSVDLTNMTVEHANLWVEDGRITATSSHFLDSDIEADSNRGGGSLRLENSDVTGANVILGGSGGTIRRNTLHTASIIAHGRDGLRARGDIEDNTVSGGSILLGGGINQEGENSLLVKGNTVTAGILVDNAYESSIVGNLVTRCGSQGSGIKVTGFTRLSLFDGNVVTGVCPYGISFESPSGGNVYSNNILTGATAVPVIDWERSNTDGGGNKPYKAMSLPAVDE